MRTLREKAANAFNLGAPNQIVLTHQNKKARNGFDPYDDDWVKTISQIYRIQVPEGGLKAGTL